LDLARPQHGSRRVCANIEKFGHFVKLSEPEFAKFGEFSEFFDLKA
jgi:hypothetical protein